MPTVPIRNLNFIRRENPRLYEALTDIQQALQPATQEPPPALNSISVASLGNGSVDVSLADNGPVTQSVNYFVEHADNKDFRNPRIEDLGASRNGTIVVGTVDRYFRGYSQHRFPPSQPNVPVVFGSGVPTAVNGGGATTGALAASAGSGTANTNGQQGNWGFGRVRVRQ